MRAPGSGTITRSTTVARPVANLRRGVGLGSPKLQLQSLAAPAPARAQFNEQPQGQDRRCNMDLARRLVETRAIQCCGSDEAQLTRVMAKLVEPTMSSTTVVRPLVEPTNTPHFALPPVCVV